MEYPYRTVTALNKLPIKAEPMETPPDEPQPTVAVVRPATPYARPYKIPKKAVLKKKEPIKKPPAPVFSVYRKIQPNTTLPVVASSTSSSTYLVPIDQKVTSRRK